MRLKLLLTVVGTLLAMAACRGSGSVADGRDFSAVPLFGTPSDSYSFTVSENLVSLESDAIPESGLFLSVSSNDDSRLYLKERNDNSNLLFMETYHEGHNQIGVFALDNEKDLSFRAEFSIGAITSDRSSHGFEDPYKVEEVTVVPYPNESLVRLIWVERNIGDYDFNGIVNQADLSALAGNLGKRGVRDSSAASTTPEYYIDGDGNNEINVADIVPIARNFGNTISGYFIYRNGNLLQSDMNPGPAFFSRDDEDAIINNRPVHFSVPVQGDFEDRFYVQPIDWDGEQQSPSVEFDGVELQARLEISPALQDGEPSLFDLSGNGSTFHQPNQDKSSYFCVMRVIEPGDIVNGIDDPPGLLNPELWNTSPQSADAGIRADDEGYRFDKLRRPESPSDAAVPYQLEILVAPTVNLLTGESRSYSGNVVPNNFYYRFAVPVMIQPGHRTLLAELMLDLVPAEDGPGYDAVIYSHQTLADENLDDSVVHIALKESNKIGPPEASIRKLFNPTDGKRYFTEDFTYRPGFHDSNADGISDQLQRRLITHSDNEFYAYDPFSLKLKGEPASYDPQSGEMSLLNIKRLLGGGLEVLYASQRNLQLSEQTQITWIIRDGNDEHVVQVTPDFLEDLTDEAETIVDVSLHDGPGLSSFGLEPMFWVDQQTIILDLTSTN